MFIKVENLEKKLGGKLIFSKVNLMISGFHKYGIIGKNGSGKSTFLKIIAGLDLPSKGKINIYPAHAKINYFSQVLEIDELQNSLNINNTELSPFTYLLSQQKDLFELWKKMNCPGKNIDISNAMSEYMDMGGYELENKIFNLCKKYGINPQEKLENLSGGQKTRLQIIKLQLYDSDILLLDEPTNHLDQEGIEDFYDYIKNFKGITLIASHDRNLLNECVDRIILFENQNVTEYAGNYEKYYEQKTIERIRAEEKFRQNEKQIRKLNLAAKKLQERISKHMEKRVRLNNAISRAARLDKKNKAQKTKIILAKLKLYRDNDKMQSKNLISRQFKKLSQSRGQILDRAQRLSETNVLPKLGWSLKLDFRPQNIEGDFALKVEQLSCGYGNVKLIENLTFDLKPGEKIGVTGPNGAGKSTLLKTLAGEIPALAGVIYFSERIKIGYLDQENLALNFNVTVIDEFLKTSDDITEAEARSFLHFFLFEGDMPFRKVRTLSEGEKVKLKLAKLLYSKANLLLLDEPTNHLDLPSQEVVEKALKDFSGSIIIVTHDKTLLQHIGVQKIIQVERINKLI